MASDELKLRFKEYQDYVKGKGIDEKVINALVLTCQYAYQRESDIDYAHEISSYTKSVLDKFIHNMTGADVWALEKYAQENEKEYTVLNQYYDVLLCEAPTVFESYLYYMEKKRPYAKRFYQPRAKTLKVVVDDLQDLEDGRLKFYGLSMPSRVGKSTICIFFLSWVMGKRPNSHNAMGGHSGLLAKGFYGELLNLVATQEYTYAEIFPQLVQPNGSTIQRQSAEEFTINLGSADRFATMTCRGIDGTWTGAVDISGSETNPGYLYVDDLVRDREHSLSPQRMENTFQEYLNKMVDRKSGASCRELMVGTLWSVLDPLSRIEQQYGNNPQYRFRKIPALNENDESNFNYDINGFSTQFYRDMRERLDDAEWQAKYQQSPYVREGLLFEKSETRTFNGFLIEGECSYVAVVDPAFGGDNVSMPIGLKYDNDDVYIVDWIYSNGTVDETIPLVGNAIMKYGLHRVVFEKNNGGNLYAQKVEEYLNTFGYVGCACECRPAPNKISKEDKIMGYSDKIKKHFVFIDENTSADAEYRRSQPYQKAMNDVHMYVTVGKNKTDDACDSLAQLAMDVYGYFGDVKTQVFNRRDLRL